MPHFSEKPPSQTATGENTELQQTFPPSPHLTWNKTHKIFIDKLRWTGQTAPFRKNYEIIALLASTIVCYCLIIRAFEISLFPKMHELSRGGTQIPQLNDSFASNVCFRLLCFQKKEPPEVFCKKKVLFKKFYKIHRKKPVLESLFNKVQTFRATTLLKSALTQVFSCEYCKTFKNTSFEEYLRTAGSVPEEKLF